MIENDEQLQNTLEYLTKWANALEGMRRHADETEPNFLSHGAAGPLSEIRKGLEESRLYLETRLPPVSDNPSKTLVYGNGANVPKVAARNPPVKVA